MNDDYDKNDAILAIASRMSSKRVRLEKLLLLLSVIETKVFTCSHGNFTHF
ncbi:MAG: hypothetical protein R8K49_05235 [Mariprofundaceae bacterium]